MAKKYSKEWRINVSIAVKKWRKNNPITQETRNKLSEAGKKGNRIRIYERKDISKLKSFSLIRDRIFEKRGRKCEKCGWHTKSSFNNIIPVQLHHKDGNNKNNLEENLQILCPSCHSLTKHFMFYGRSHKK